MTTITLVGARGGSGVSTIAILSAALAARDEPVDLITHNLKDMKYLLGTDEDGYLPLLGDVTLCDAYARDDEATNRVSVYDAGELRNFDPSETDGVRLVVVRGPSSLACHAVIASTSWVDFDGMIVVEEAGRALKPADVASNAGLELVSVIPVLPSVARATDAGLIVARAEIQGERLKGIPEIARLMLG